MIYLAVDRTWGAMFSIPLALRSPEQAEVVSASAAEFFPSLAIYSQDCMKINIRYGVPTEGWPRSGCMTVGILMILPRKSIPMLLVLASS